MPELQPKLADAIKAAYPHDHSSINETQWLDLYPTSDIRFVLVELGKIGTKVDQLVEDVRAQGSKLAAVERSFDRVRMAALAGAAILTLVGGFLWWAVRDRLTVAVRNGLLGFPLTPEIRETAKPAPSPAAAKPR